MPFQHVLLPFPNRRFASHPVAIDRRSIAHRRKRGHFLSSPLRQIGATLFVFFAVLTLVYAFLGKGWAFAVGGLVSLVFIVLVIEGMRIAAKDLSQY